MCWINLDLNGYLISVSSTPLKDCNTIKTLDDLDLSGHRINAYRWDGEKLVLDEKRLAEIEAEAAERDMLERMPTEQEQLRADVDFLLIMGGYV